MRRFAAAVVLIGSMATASAAEALTTRDVIELAKAGLGEEVLLALIEVDRGVYAIDPASIKALKDAGASDRVIAALVRSGRERVADPPAPLPAPVEPPVDTRPDPQVVVIDREPTVREVMVPVYVTVPTHGRSRRSSVPSPSSSTSSTYETYVPFQSAPPVVRPRAEEPRQPVYWGFGGKLRPDAWQPTPTRNEGKKPEGGKQESSGSERKTNKD